MEVVWKPRGQDKGDRAALLAPKRFLSQKLEARNAMPVVESVFVFTQGFVRII